METEDVNELRMSILSPSKCLLLIRKKKNNKLRSDSSSSKQTLCLKVCSNDL